MAALSWLQNLGHAGSAATVNIWTKITTVVTTWSQQTPNANYLDLADGTYLVLANGSNLELAGSTALWTAVTPASDTWTQISA